MLEKAGCTKWKSEQNQRILLGCWRTRQPQWLQPLRLVTDDMSERDHKPVMHIIIKLILALVHQNFWDHPLGWRLWGMLRISSKTKSNTIRKHLLSTGKQLHLHLHEGRSRSETTIFYNEKRRFPTCSLQNEIGNQSETTIFFGETAACASSSRWKPLGNHYFLQ